MELKETTLPSVTVGFTARDHFSIAAYALQKVLKGAPERCNIIVVDCNIPLTYKKAMHEVIKGDSRVSWIHVDRYLHPNESRNIVLSATTDDYVCFVENDNYVPEGWLDALVTTAESHNAGVVVPRIYEGRPEEVDGNPENGKFHQDTGSGDIERTIKDGKEVLHVVTDIGNVLEREHWTSPAEVRTIEWHHVLFSRHALNAITPFDEAYADGEHVDLNLALFHHGIKTVYDPNVVISFSHADYIREDEWPFYKFRWNTQHAKEGRERTIEKWNATGVPNIEDFAKSQLLRWKPVQSFLHRASCASGWALDIALSKGKKLIQKKR